MRGMGVTDDQISSITAAQRNIRQMTDMANILPTLLSGGPGFAGGPSPNASNNGSAGGNRPVERSDPSSPEKQILLDRLIR